MASDLSLRGQVAYVTGSTRGIGRAIAEILASHGASVVVNGHTDTDATARAASELRNTHGTDCIGIHADQRKAEAAQDAFKAIFERYRRLDILVNNAGIVDDALLGMISADSLSGTFEINALAVVRNTQLAARLMRRGQRGSIINLSSIMGTNGNTGEVVYSATKAAVIGATKAAAKELAGAGIRVNAIAPGFVDTDMTRDLPERIYQERLDSIGMGRIGQPLDVARVALFLASDLSSYVTGQVIGVDGSMVV